MSGESVINGRDQRSYCPIPGQFEVAIGSGADPASPIMADSRLICGDTQPQSSAGSLPYSADYSYLGVNANYMYREGGDGHWGNLVRSCLECMYYLGLSANDSHVYCYERSAQRTGFWPALGGLGSAIWGASKYYVGSLWEGTKNFFSKLWPL